MGKIAAISLLIISLTACGVIPGFQSETGLSKNLSSILEDFIGSIEEQNTTNRGSSRSVSFTQSEIDSIRRANIDAFKEFGLNEKSSTIEVLKVIIPTSIEKLNIQSQEYIRANNIGAISKAVIVSFSKNRDDSGILSDILGDLGGEITRSIDKGGIGSGSYPGAISSHTGSFIPSLNTLPITSTNINSIIHSITFSTASNLEDFWDENSLRRSYSKLATSTLFAIEELDWLYLDNPTRRELTIEVVWGLTNSFELNSTIGDLSLLGHDLLVTSIIAVHQIQRLHFDEPTSDEFTISILKEMITVVTEGVYRRTLNSDSLRNQLYDTVVVNNSILTEVELDDAITQGVLNASS